MRAVRSGWKLITVTARFGLDAALPDILMALAAWNGGQDCSHPYGARFTDLRVFSGLPSLYPEAEAQAKRRVGEPEPMPQ